MAAVAKTQDSIADSDSIQVWIEFDTVEQLDRLLDYASDGFKKAARVCKIATTPGRYKLSLVAMHPKRIAEAA